MYAFLEGTLEESSPLSATLNIQGIGYYLNIPVTTAEKLPPHGETVKLWVLPVYREDSQALYGFHAREERDFFRLVTEKVSGIGPRIALNLLSKLSLPLLMKALRENDISLLSKCPGIGKKTAERLCIELRDKIGVPNQAASSSASTTSTVVPNEQSTHYDDAINALITLGYKADVADKSIRKALDKLGPDATTETLIKAALR